MKKNKVVKYLYILSLIGIVSCKNNPLDITPDGRLTIDSIFSDQIKTEAYLNTVYGNMPLYFDSYDSWNFLAGCTDDAEDAAIGNVGTTAASAWVVGSLSPSVNPLTLGGTKGIDRYSTFSVGIRQANIFLSNIDHVVFNDESRKSRLIAEAHLLRAFYYFELIKQFGPMPIQEEPYNMNRDFSELSRPSFQENIDLIVADCDFAISTPELPLRLTTESFKGLFTKAVAYALKSRALLYNASPLWNPENEQSKWREASKASKEAIDALSMDGLYELAADYGNYFLTNQDLSEEPNDKETIYEAAQSYPLNAHAIPSEPDSWKPGATPTQELVDAYGMKTTGEPILNLEKRYNDENHLDPNLNLSSGYDPQNPFKDRDPRFYATVWYNGAEYDNINGRIHIVETFVGGADQLRKNPPNTANTHTGYYLRKFTDPKLTVKQTSSARGKIFRLAELYLNYAEAENEVNGPSDNVYDAVNKIRERADMPDLRPDLTKDQMRLRIRNERRVEFPYEDHRFWDVRRWKILDQTDKLVTGMEPIRNNDGTFSYKRFVVSYRSAWQDKFLIFPIPIDDASILNFQNPGW